MKLDVGIVSTIQWRVIATLTLLIISIIIIIEQDIKVEENFIVGVVAGILVLATAGIWVAYFAEWEAHRTIKKTAEEIQNSTELIRDCSAIGLRQVFPSANDTEYQNFLERTLARANPKLGIDMMGIACQGVFHADGGPSNSQIKKLANLETTMRVVLQHPLSEPAISRGVREDRNRTRIDDYSNSTLFGDVLQSCEGIIALAAEPHVEARLCPISIHCRAIFIEDTMIYEPHHFGDDNQRASIGTPVFVFSNHCDFARNLWEHFEFLWAISRDHRVDTSLLESVRKSSSKLKENIALLDYVKLVRPDLCG